MRNMNAMVIGHDHDPELAAQYPDALPHGRDELHTMRTAEQVAAHYLSKVNATNEIQK
jgi:hypothetical protein